MIRLMVNIFIMSGSQIAIGFWDDGSGERLPFDWAPEILRPGTKAQGLAAPSPGSKVDVGKSNRKARNDPSANKAFCLFHGPLKIP